MNELPSRGPNDPPIPGPHQIIGEPGITHHMVFAGPNTWPPATAAPKPSRLREVGHHLYATVFVFSIVAAVITAGLLVLEYPQLTVESRLACGTITVLVCAWIAARRTRRRRVRG